ncbi:MAG: nucleotidyltransferase domain-containing protein [Terrimicrobiaceae bacterium]|jgi:predicted nucleotidyltransferase
MKTFGIREDVLRDTRYPVHRIADRLLPYLKVLVEQFHPEQVILFGSYAYGSPDEHSDVDLLVVKPIQQSRIKDKVAMRSAWWPILRQGSPLSFDLLLAKPEERLKMEADANSYYGDIVRRGIQVV